MDSSGIMKFISSFPVNEKPPKQLIVPVNKDQLISKGTARVSSGVSYYEFVINEASYKFWVVFQLVTVVVLLYSTFAAIYYARYNYLMNLESGEYDDLLFARSLRNRYHHFPRLNIQTFQRIVDAVLGEWLQLQKDIVDTDESKNLPYPNASFVVQYIKTGITSEKNAV